MNRLSDDEQALADGLWYLENMARTHQPIAAVLARYRALEATLVRVPILGALDSDTGVIRWDHEIDARELGY